MTESAQPAAATADGFPVDASTKYKIDAGQCEHCGYYKTWGLRIQNKKSGKMMPGHVTAEGFKIGEGDCPKWAKLADINKKKAEKRAAGAPAAPPAPGAWIQDITGGRAASVVQSPAFASAPGQPQGTAAAQPAPAAAALVQGAAGGPEPGPVVAFTVNGFTVTTSLTQAASVVEQIGAALRKALGSGA
jgi:hypothetical protein